MIDWRVALFAGVAAGLVSMLAQLALWAAFTDALPAILWRDARLAAAIVVGPAALSPPDTFDARVFAIASVVHFMLSIVYGFAVSLAIARLRAVQSLLAGAAFGAILYAVNMHGFTALYPWFEATRDWITFAAHVAFGISATAAYKLACRGSGPRLH